MELVTEPTGHNADESFLFRVNGVPLWARGANVVPLHAVEKDAAAARSLVAAARAANMNMLRAWGGGRYLNGEIKFREIPVGTMQLKELMMIFCF